MARIFTELQAQADAKNLITWDINVRATVCRGPPARDWGAEKGDPQKEPPVASPPLRTTTASGVRAAA
ncbi:hypothetical protein ACFYWY_10860 [Streptomyces sp. NPDC002870]|uniref:hypothetical protein n=1 Tax=Streptomyces sp. NPDC002870 TaxID=3364666 RepID=UPI0036A87B96